MIPFIVLGGFISSGSNDDYLLYKVFDVPKDDI
jgi:hypothetical protein